MNSELLAGYGIDYEKGMRNCMGNAAFYRKILNMFLQDGCFARAKAACECGDYKELFNRVHELKGVSGNTGLIALYQATVLLLDLLRMENGAEEDIKRLFAEVEAAYGRAREGAALIVAEG